MIIQQKYRFTLAAITMAFIWILVFELADRMSGTIAFYQEISRRKETTLTLGELQGKKRALHAQKKNLSLILTRSSKRYGRNQAGAFEYLNTKATENGIEFESLVPLGTREINEAKETTTRVSFTAAYHQAGMFVNAIETGDLPVSIIKLEMLSDPVGTQPLHCMIEGKITVY